MITARLHHAVGQWPGPGHSNALYSWLIPPDRLSRFELQIDQRALRSEIFGFALVSVLVCDNLWFFIVRYSQSRFPRQSNLHKMVQI